MVARGRFELPSMGLFLVRESKANHWPGHCFRPLLVHYTTGLQETRVSGQDPISLLRNLVSWTTKGYRVRFCVLSEPPKREACHLSKKMTHVFALSGHLISNSAWTRILGCSTDQSCSVEIVQPY